MSKEEIGLRIKKLRIHMGLTKDKLAKSLSISSQYLGMIERGKGSLSVDKLRIFCDMAGVSSDYVLFGTDPSKVEDTKKWLSNYSDDQISSGCDCLSKLAIFIKYLDL